MIQFYQLRRQRQRDQLSHLIYIQYNLFEEILFEWIFYFDTSTFYLR